MANENIFASEMAILQNLRDMKKFCSEKKLFFYS